MRHTLRMLVLALSVMMMLFVHGGGCSSSSATLTTIALNPATASIAVGATQQLTALGTYDDQTTKDVTDQVTWGSMSPTVATVDSKGLATGVAAGSATITATLSGITGTAALGVTTSVTPVSIAITPANPTIGKGTGQQLTATGTYKDNSTKDLTTSVEWKSSDAKIVTFSSAAGMEGLATGVDAGTATITATLNGVSASTTATVTMATLSAIQVTSPDPYVAKGMMEQFSAMGIFSDDTRQDLTKQVSWASSSTAVSITAGGLATAAAEGTAVISATMMGITGQRWFGVTSATLGSIAVTPVNPTIAKGTQVALVASGVLSDHTLVDLTPFVQWTSASTSVATVLNDGPNRGTVTAVDTGTAVISASFGGKNASTTVTVTPATLSKVSLVPLNPVIPKGTTLAISAIGTFSDGSAQDLTTLAVWGSSDIAVASISNATWSHGVVTALAQGHTTITATVNGKSDSTTLTVSPATLVSIAITPANPSIPKGTSVQLAATATFSDKSVFDVTGIAMWTSSDPSVTVSLGTAGIANGVAIGSSLVKATLAGVSGQTTVTVTAATLSSIQVTPANPSIAKGTSLWFRATGTFSDESTLDLTRWVTWSSSDASVAISNAWQTHGLAVGQVEGKSTITATFFGSVSGSTTLSVTSATLVSLALTPSQLTLAKGTGAWLTLTGTYTDNSKQDLTNQASWESSDPSVSVSSIYALWGLVSGVDVGSATVSAHFGGKTATATVTVTAAVLTSLSLSPVDPSMAKGTALWFSVTGHYSDASTQDLSFLAAYSSSDPTIALISNADGARGLATGVSPGKVTISADFGGKTVSTQLTVTTANLTSIAISPANPTVAAGGTRQLGAVGTFSDNTTQDLTSLVTWYTADSATAIVSNAVGSRGLVTGVHAGSTTVSALIGGMTGTTTLTVQ